MNQEPNFNKSNNKGNESFLARKIREKMEEGLNILIAKKLAEQKNKDILDKVIAKVDDVMKGSDELEKQRWDNELNRIGLGDLPKVLEDLLNIRSNPGKVASYLGFKKATQVKESLDSLLRFAGVK